MPTGLGLSHVARNLNDAAEGFLIGKRCLIHGRGPLLTEEFLKTVQTNGIEWVKLPPALAESECRRRALGQSETSRNHAWTGRFCSAQARCGRASTNSWCISMGEPDHQDLGNSR